MPLDLVTHIPLCSMGHWSVTSDRSYYGDSVLFNPDEFDNAEFYFEIVARNIDSVDRYAWFWDQTNSIAYGQITIPASTTNHTRLRAKIDKQALLSGENDYCLRVDGTASIYDIEVQQARVVVKQKNATRCRFYIPLSLGNYSSGNASADADVWGGSDATWQNEGNTGIASRFLKDESKLPIGIKDKNAWRFEVRMRIQNELGTAYASLWNESTNNQITESQISTTSTTQLKLTAYFSNDAVHFTDGDVIGARRTSDPGGAGYYNYIGSATVSVFVDHDLDKAQIFQHLLHNETNWNNTETTYEEDRILFENEFSNPQFEIHTRGRHNDAGYEDCLVLVNDGSNTSGTGGTDTNIVVPIAGSTDDDYYIKHFVLEDGVNYYLKKNGTTYASETDGAWLIINVGNPPKSRRLPVVIKQPASTTPKFGVPFKLNRSSPQANGLTHWWPVISNPGLDVLQDKLLGAGISHNADWVVNRFGYVPKFNGTSDYGSVAVNLQPYSKFSIAMWVYWDAYAQDDDLLLEYTVNYNNNDGVIIDPNDSVYSSFGVYLKTQELNGGYFTRPSAATWHHMTFWFDRSLGTSLETGAIVDGVEQTLTQTHSADNSSNDFDNDSFYFFSRAGSSLFGAGRVFDIRMYLDKVVSEEEARHIYLNPWQLYDFEEPSKYFFVPEIHEPVKAIVAPNINLGHYTKPPMGEQFELNRNSPLARGLIFWLPGAGQNSFTPQDKASGRIMTLTGGGPTWPNISPDDRYGSMIEFVTGGYDILEIPTTLSSWPITIAAFFRPHTDTIPMALSIADSSVTRTYMSIGATGSYPATSFHVTADQSTYSNLTGRNSSIIENQWAHVVLTTRSATDHECWVNGTPQDTDATSVATAGYDRIVVAAHGDSTPSNQLTGKVAEAMVWNRALSNAEIQSLYLNPWQLYKIRKPFFMVDMSHVQYKTVVRP